MPHCYKCLRYKDTQDFYADKSRILKVASLCKDCAKVERSRRKKRAKIRNFLAMLAAIR